MPPPGPLYQSVSIKFSFSDSRGRQNGRVHWRFDANNAKFLFFTPLNQVGLELDVAGETALLLRPGKKICWRGDFSRLLDRLWGIELHLEELKQLILEGSIPEGKINEKGMTIDLETDPGNRSPRVIGIRRNEASLTLKIISSETRPGHVVLLVRGRRFEAVELEEILGDD